MNPTPLRTLLGTEVPILQAPIGSVACPRLAAAVSEAGGLGALALTWTTEARAAELVTETTRLTPRPFQVNFVLAFEARQLTSVLDAGAPVITFSWGIPTWHAGKVRSYGRPFGVQVSSVDGARKSLDAGADFLICQGWEAGGHIQATRSLWESLPGILAEAGRVPVIAAGGIATGRSVARALRAGASGAMLGTRFIATQESNAHASYKAAVVAATAEDCALTVCFDGGWPYAAHRVLRNATLDRWEAAGCPPRGMRPGEADIVASTTLGDAVRRYQDFPALAGMTGDVDQLSLYCGLGCTDIHDIPPAADVVRRIWQDALEATALAAPA